MTKYITISQSVFYLHFLTVGNTEFVNRRVVLKLDLIDLSILSSKYSVTNNKRLNNNK